MAWRTAAAASEVRAPFSMDATTMLTAKTGQIPLERAGVGLVEVVEIEQQPTVGRREEAEVGEVRVARQLGEQGRSRTRAEVGSHDGCRAPQERPRRLRHPPVTDGHQLGYAIGVLLAEDVDGIAA
jgi:hypothetical protein